MGDKEEKKIFREEALKKLYSAEDLEKALYVTKPINWLFLIIMFLLSVAVIIWSFLGSISTIVSCQGIYLDLSKFKVIVAPATGHVVSSSVLVGDNINEGDVIATIWDENEKKEIQVKSTYSGFVSDLFFEKGSQVTMNQVVANLQHDIGGGEQNHKFYCFVEAKIGEKIKEGMKGVVYPWGISEDVGGGIKSKVENISYLPASSSYFKSIHLNNTFISHLTSSQTLLPLTITPQLVDGKLQWTSARGPEEMPLGTLVTAHVYISSKKPITYLFPGLDSGKNSKKHEEKNNK
jgi:hypothetical protein